MRAVVMDVIEVHRRGKRGVAGAREEVQAAVHREDGVALLDDGFHRRKADHVVVALATGERFECFHRVFELARVDIVQVDAAFSRVLDRVNAFCAL